MPPAFPWPDLATAGSGIQSPFLHADHCSFAAKLFSSPQWHSPLPGPLHRQSVLTWSRFAWNRESSWCFVAREMEPHPSPDCLFADIPHPCLHFRRLEVPDQSTTSRAAPGTIAQTLDF